MSFGDYTTYQKWNTPKNKDQVILAADATAQLAGVIAAKSANHQLFIQKIMVNPTTAAAQALTFQDTTGTPIKIAVFAASQATPQVFDFGPKGVALGVGKNLDITCTAGVAALVHIEAYEKISSGAINTGTIASGQ